LRRWELSYELVEFRICFPRFSQGDRDLARLWRASPSTETDPDAELQLVLLNDPVLRKTVGKLVGARRRRRHDRDRVIAATDRGVVD